MAISYHRPTAIFVDLAVIKENVAHAVLQQQGKRDVFVAVKANGYGHGAVPVPKPQLLQGQQGFVSQPLMKELPCEKRGLRKRF